MVVNNESFSKNCGNGITRFLSWSEKDLHEDEQVFKVTSMLKMVSVEGSWLYLLRQFNLASISFKTL